MSPAPGHPDPGEERPRPLPLIRDVAVWAALMGFLALSCWAAYWPLGPITTVIGLAIAGAKAGLVAAMFMNLKRGTSLIRLTGLAGFFWIAILFALTLSDVLTRL